jgi:hypothetical protein
MDIGAAPGVNTQVRKKDLVNKNILSSGIRFCYTIVETISIRNFVSSSDQQFMIAYFKPRDRFDFSDDTLDIGNPLTWKRAHFLKHLFKRVFAINEDRIEEFYRRHLAYYLANNANGNEETFFKTLWELIERQLKVLTGKDVYDKHHVRNQREIDRLKKFTGMLISLDRWNFHKSGDAVIAQQETELYTLKEQLQQLKAELQKATALETKQYINIPKGRLLAFIDLCIKMGDLQADGRELVFSEFPIVWVKLICKYFREDNQEIDFERVRRYFPKDRRNPGNRSGKIPTDQQLFEIKPLKRRS